VRAVVRAVVREMLSEPQAEGVHDASPGVKGRRKGLWAGQEGVHFYFNNAALPPAHAAQSAAHRSSSPPSKGSALCVWKRRGPRNGSAWPRTRVHPLWHRIASQGVPERSQRQFLRGSTCRPACNHHYLPDASRPPARVGERENRRCAAFCLHLLTEGPLIRPCTRVSAAMRLVQKHHRLCRHHS
jgi:hypothetical protein